MSFVHRITNVLRGKWQLRSEESQLEKQEMEQALERDLERDRLQPVPGPAAREALESLKRSMPGAPSESEAGVPDDEEPPAERTL